MLNRLRLFWERHEGILAGTAATFFSLIFFLGGGFEGFDDRLTSMIFQAGFAAPTAVPPIFIVKKDEHTSKLLGRSPGRREFAGIFRRLNEGNPAVLSFDFLLQGLKASDSDRLFAEAIASSPAPMVLAAQYSIDVRQESTVLSSEEGARGRQGRMLSSQVKHVSVVLPEKIFCSGNTHLGLINIGLGNKDFVQRVPLFYYIPDEDRLTPSFSLLSAVLLLDRTVLIPQNGTYFRGMQDELTRLLPIIKSGEIPKEFRLPDRTIPLDGNGFMRVNFFGSTQPDIEGRKVFNSASFHDCFDRATTDWNKQRRPKFKARLEPSPQFASSDTSHLPWNNAICLIGPFERADGDYYDTPLTLSTPFCRYSQSIMGVEIHANAIMTILTKRFLEVRHTLHTVIAVIVATIVLSCLLVGCTPGKGFIITLAFLTGICGIAFHAFHSWGHVFLLSPFFMSFPLTWAYHSLSSYIKQQQKEAQIRNTFQRFVNADVVRYMIANPDKIKLGGEKFELTVFFSDVAGFTSISEALTAENLVILLNEYLGAMTDILFKYNGTLDKFIGDAVMAFWNAPSPVEEHAVKGCLCAIEMQAKILELQKGWAERGFPKVSARAGLNTTTAIVGFVGSETTQRNYTCMGDGVNLASDLEAANKGYETLLMISDNTYRLAKDRITVRYLDLIEALGEPAPIKVYQLVSEKGKEPPEWAEMIVEYDRGIALYQERKWSEAAGVFADILARWPEDGPSKTYLHRCHAFEEHPPAADWNGTAAIGH
ncbi:MAG: adenylate/guanylate cyclase domain-containing protein [Candidatus Riflebacteria bacterium]|nr:adenylate/guanylate cyclase domain-containing protein [Candidatus Riflebacteria bacterium]